MSSFKNLKVGAPTELVHFRFGPLRRLGALVQFSLYLHSPLIRHDKEARQASSRLGLVHPQRAEAKKAEP